MKLLWLDYLVYSLGNCVMKLCIETGLKEHVMLVFDVVLAPMKLVVIKNVLVEEVSRCSIYP